jgi:hypothetical protein
MTLSITVLTEATIYQSADFRLTDLSTRHLVSDSSNKLVITHYKQWTGCITYTGLGLLSDGQHVSAVLASWLVGLEEASMEEVALLVRERATKWFQQLFPDKRPLRHTFTLAGFVASQPRAYVISNFEQWEGAVHPVAVEFEVSSISSSDTKVIITGCKPAIKRTARRLLEREISHCRDDPARVRLLLEKANRDAAGTLGAAGLVSPDCVVYSFDVNGFGRSLRPEHVPGMAEQLMHGVDLNRIILPEVERLLGTKLIAGRLLAAGRSGSLEVASQVVCSPRIVDVQDGRYRCRLLSTGTEMDFYARAINDRSDIAGEGPLVKGGPPMPWARVNGTWQPLPVPPGAFGYARDINLRGHIVGGCVTKEAGHLEHAWYWDTTGASKDLDGRLNYESCARRLSPNGEIAGRLRLGFRQENAADNTPIVWSGNNYTPETPHLSQGQCGEAIGITEEGTALVVLGDATRERTVHLWRRGSRTLDALSGPPLFYPCDIDPTGTFILGTVGRGRTSEVVLLTEPQGWTAVRCPTAAFPTCVNRAGHVAGAVLIDGFYQPWVSPFGQAPQMLPFMAFHNTIPTSINGRGDVVGTAATDHGCHSLLWEALDSHSADDE